MSVKAYSQNDPPPAALPADENKVLLDELIKVTAYEVYFKQYCLMKIRKAAEEQKWTDEYKKIIIDCIDFKYFQSTFYNVFALMEKSDLQRMVDFYREINKSKTNFKYIITNSMLTNSLDGHANYIVKGYYISQKKG